MTLDELLEELPPWAKDLRLNLQKLTAGGGALDGTQLWGALLASAVAARHDGLTRALAAAAEEHLDETSRSAALSAAALMSMNNVYYRALHLMGNDEYGRLPAGLRMTRLAGHGADPQAFELWALAVSAVNGCGLCLDGHERTLRSGGVRAEPVQEALKVGAVVAAVAVALQGAQALATSPAA